MIVSHSNIHTLYTPTNKLWTLVGKCGYLTFTLCTHQLTKCGHQLENVDILCIHFVSDVHECGC